MDRQQTINVIHDYLAGQPVVKAWIFGSFAHGEEKAQSDIDILFIPDFEHGPFTLLTHGGMYEDLKQLWGGVKSIWWLTALCDRMPRRVWNGTKYWSMRESVRDKGRLEDIVENDEVTLSYPTISPYLLNSSATHSLSVIFDAKP